MKLRELDDRLVPRVAVGLRRLLERVPRTRSQSQSQSQSTDGQALRAAPLPRAGADPGAPDEETGRRGLIGLVRDVPQLAALVVATVFLAAGAFVLDRASDDRQAQRLDLPGVEQEVPVAASSALGPEVGADVVGYLSRAREDVSALAQRDGDGRYLALVLLSDYVTPTALSSVLQGFGVRQVYLRAPAAGELAEVIEVPTPGDPLAFLDAVYARTAADKREQEREFRALADSIEGTGAQDADDRAAYLVDANRVAAEASAYGADCACVFAAVVDGTAMALAGLFAAPGVRGVEVAGRGTELAALEVRPLWPEVQGVVPTPPPAP